MTKRKTQADLIFDHRVARFGEMGFSQEQSIALASRGIDGWLVDTQRVKKALAAGCDLAAAVSIFGPL